MEPKSWWVELPDETLTESAWERQMTIAGIEAFERAKYRPSGEVQAASESVAGQKMLRGMIDKGTEAVGLMQRQVIKAHRMDRTVKGTVLVVPAETSCLITLRILMDKTYSAPDSLEGANYQVVCKDVSKAIEMELNFRNWVQSSKAASKAYAQAQGMAAIPKSLAERLIEEEGVTRVTMYRWKKAFQELNEYRWDILGQHYCGDALVTAVVAALPEAFELHIVQNVNRHPNVPPDRRPKVTPLACG